MSGEHQGTVLVVEDDRGVRDLLVTVLRTEGFEVRTAKDGLEGLLKLRMCAPSAVVLDIMMPDVGGMRVLDALAEEQARVPVIVVTGKPEAAEEAIDRLGAENVFPKPFDVDELVARIRAVADRSEG
ncbi:MAG: response regulator transcription factor [Egibacteraceae bacterium]